MSVTTGTPGTTADAPGYRLDAAGRRVFVGLMLGMLVAAVSQTIVGPALPRIVAELGGMQHYSWLATAPMLVSAVSVPIVGKMSDLYGRRLFYLSGLLVFMLGSLLSGLAPSFWFLVFARALQGFGMGALMPLSQTIIGDLVPPRQRGTYQGIMGGVFGLTSIVGPLAGGVITDHWGWRWLFFVSLPVGIVAFVAIHRFLRLEHTPTRVRIDVAGIVTLTVGLVLVLLATSLGGTSFAWGSPTIIGMFGVGAVFLLAFVAVETRAPEPIIPLHLFRSSIFTFSNLASFAVAMLMFGALIYIPVYAQGVLGVDATDSGLILVPMMVSMIGLSILSGLYTTKTGRYKELILLGPALMGAGMWLLVRLGYDATPFGLTAAMVVFGVGLGLCMQVYTLVVQNVVMRRDLGVATASTQFFRNVGSTVGIAVFGTIMTSRAATAIAEHLPPGAAAALPAGGVDAGSVLDPGVLAGLPDVVVRATRMGLADALHLVFLAGLPVALLAFLASLCVKVVPLRDTIHTAQESGRELLDTMGQQAPSGEIAVPLGREEGARRTRERLLGLQLALLAEQARREDRPLLDEVIVRLGDGDRGRGRALLERTAHMLLCEEPEQAAAAEPFAVAVAEFGRRPGGVLGEGLRARLTAAAAQVDDERVLAGPEPAVADRFEGLDVRALESVGSDVTAALLVDLHRARGDARAG